MFCFTEARASALGGCHRFLHLLSGSVHRVYHLCSGQATFDEIFATMVFQCDLNHKLISGLCFCGCRCWITTTHFWSGRVTGSWWCGALLFLSSCCAWPRWVLRLTTSTATPLCCSLNRCTYRVCVCLVTMLKYLLVRRATHLHS